METVKKFYDDISKYYHLIYSDWDESIHHQGKTISGIIVSNWWISNFNILDCTCGIGTQSLGLAMQGYKLTGSDISDSAINRAKAEASKRNLKLDFAVSDVRELWNCHRKKFDIVISCDNSLPHLPDDQEFKRGLTQIYKCIKTNGGCVISVRDYEKDISSGTHLFPYGIRQVKNERWLVFQNRSYYNKDHYNIDLYFVKDTGRPTCKTFVFRSEYYAIPIKRIMEIMKIVGFKKIRRIDNVFFQPVIVGTKSK
jgi:SAM-dependent methyltransferase